LGGDYAKTGSPGFQIGTADSSAKNLNVIVDSRPIDESPFPCLDVTGTVGGDEGNTLKNVYPN
jgi:hypothetical protein